MSHYTVLVIGDDPEKQLAPFEESTENLERGLLEFVDEEDSYLQKYENESVEMVVMEDDSLKSPYDDIFKQGEMFDQKYVVPEHLQKRQVPHKERFATFETFVADYQGIEERDPDKQRYGYWRNPRAKWDWYSLGGRWTGYFRLKVNATGETGRPGLMTKPAKTGYADQVRKKDVDVKKMRKHARKEAQEHWNEFQKVLAGRELPPRWSEVREKHGTDIEAARKEYNSLPVVIDLNKADLMPFMGALHDRFGCTEEAFLQRAEDNALTSYAILYNGQWYERGEMGWFGMSHNEKDPDEWSREFAKLFDSLPDDTLLSLYDCHI